MPNKKMIVKKSESLNHTKSTKIQLQHVREKKYNLIKGKKDKNLVKL